MITMTKDETTEAACCAPTCCEPDEAVKQETLPSEGEAVKASVREKYAQIAVNEASCCGVSCCNGKEISMIGDAYDTIDGYVADADLGLGCGLPTEHARLVPGHSVLDLGSGAGLDAFVARRIVGEEGEVIGVDMTPEMNTKARANAETLGYENVRFLEGDIEALPLEDDTIDVVISNCVLNLVPDKARAFAEMYRVLRPGGHFCVSDIVYEGQMPPAVKRSAELYAGCVAGAMEHDAYLTLVEAAGFKGIDVVKKRAVEIPESVYQAVLTPEEHESLRASGATILSVTVYGEKA